MITATKQETGLQRHRQVTGVCNSMGSLRHQQQKTAKRSNSHDHSMTSRLAQQV